MVPPVKEAAEKFQKAASSRAEARSECQKYKDLDGAAEAAPLQKAAEFDFFSSLSNPAPFPRASLYADCVAPSRFTGPDFWGTQFVHKSDTEQ